MSNLVNEELIEGAYEMGFDYGYKKCLSDLENKFKNHIDEMIKNISKQFIQL